MEEIFMLGLVNAAVEEVLMDFQEDAVLAIVEEEIVVVVDVVAAE
mgnify:CR=1 FL=1